MNNIIQGSPEWFALRAGKFTASKFSDLMATLRNGNPAQSRENLIWDVAVERMTGRKMDSFQSGWMARGIELEPEARSQYEVANMTTVEEVGIVIHPAYPYVSCSPDGLVGDDGLVEIKCLTAANHGKALLHGKHADDYQWQVQGQMWITGRSWCDVVAYHPDFPIELQLATVRVERSDGLIADLEESCIKANEEVEKVIAQLESARFGINTEKAA